MFDDYVIMMRKSNGCATGRLQPSACGQKLWSLSYDAWCRHTHTSTYSAKQVTRHHFFAFRFLETTRLMPNTYTRAHTQNSRNNFSSSLCAPNASRAPQIVVFLMCLLSLRHSTFSSSSHWLPSHCAPFYRAGPLLNDFYFPSTQNEIEKMLQLRQQ